MLLQATNTPMTNMPMRRPTLVEVLLAIGRTKAYTPPNGDCAILACMQTQLYFEQSINEESDRVLQEALAKVGETRRLAGKCILDESVLRQYLEKIHLPLQTSLLRTRVVPQREPAVYTSADNFVKLGYSRPYAEGGIWFDSLGIRALAITMESNVVVLDTTTFMCTVYSQHRSHLSSTLRQLNHPRVFNPSYIVSFNASSTIQLPRLIFDPRTIVILYNGSNHFDATVVSPDLLNHLLHNIDPNLYQLYDTYHTPWH
jgi:hypothetical protein